MKRLYKPLRICTWCTLLVAMLLLAFPAQAQTPSDTLRHLPSGIELTAFRHTNPGTWGYITGINYRGTEEYAEKYEITGSGKLLGVVAHLTGVMQHGSHIAEFNAYSVGTNGLPDVRIASKQVFYRDLDLSGQPLLVPFNLPVTVSDSFFVSFNVSDYSHGGFEGDTIAVKTGPDGSRTAEDLSEFGRNAVRRHNHSKLDWGDLYTQNFTPIATHLAIYPIVELATSTALTDPAVIASSLVLHPAYPNPARETFSVDYTLNLPSDVRIELYDLLGRRVHTEVVGPKALGRHQEIIPVDKLAPGVYFYAVINGGIRLMSTIVISK